MIKVVACCAECPCHFIDVDPRGEHNESRCTLLDAPLYFDTTDGIDQKCPLKSESLLLTIHANEVI